jgi:hypothetical protein
MGIISRATRSSKSTQIYQGSHGFYRKISRGQQLVINFGPSPITPGAIWDIGASTEYRTSAKSPTKKGLNTSPSGTKQNIIDKDGLSSRYEQLRSQALGQLFTSGQGLGLTLFMRKGMAAWTHAWTKYSSKAAMAHFSETDTKNRFTDITSKQITMVLTNMVMEFNQKETENGFSNSPESDKRTSSTKSISLCPSIFVATGTYEPREHGTSICSAATSTGVGLAPSTGCYNRY